MKLAIENRQRTDFQISDLYLASAVSLITNLIPEYTIHDGKVYFCFPKTPEIVEAVASYSDGILVNAYEYAFRIKRLRADMLSRKNELNGQGKWGSANGRAV